MVESINDRKFLFLIVFISIFMESCSVTRYDYYYATMSMKSHESSIGKKDSVNFRTSYFIFFSGFMPNLYIKNYKPVYIDYAESQINVNNIIYKIEQPDAVENKNKDDTVLFVPNRFGFSEKVYLPEIIESKSDIYMSDLYNEYDETGYTSYIPSIDEVKIKTDKNDHDGYKFDLSEYKKLCRSKILCKEFTNDNTPLKISFVIVYYTDSLFQDRHTVSLDLYQSRLLKIKDIRYEENRDNEIYHWGRKIAWGMESVSFFTKSKSGKIWGWPEARYGLGWTLTVITLPITLPINLIGFIGSTYEDWPIPTPLFE